MTITSTSASAAKRRQIRSGLGIAALAALLSSCGNNMTTGSVPDDYRTRHPIVLAEGESSLDIPIGSGDVRLTIGLRDTVKGFAQRFVSSPAGVIQVQVPQGSYNAGAASHLAGDVRRTLIANGIKPQRILMTSYGASPTGDAAPIRLSFVTTKAMTGQCGKWPADLSNDTYNNSNWYNFGCASQNNLAAQIASPSDLIAPRGMTPIDATQRAGVIRSYRGETTSSDSGSGTTININGN
ncbi:CpaD family pilus assembly protein [Neorhizobium sp. IRS_2294]|jgi:pilus assembly protein CpaD|uniref:CpaD family pilus assembly protein n=1 Tax=unclassified Neorhizobium TaxID=2629175 RepID=UPI003D29B0B8